MCKNHVFSYPEDTRDNYNLDGKTLTGVCKCGATKRAYGRRWSIQLEENFLRQVPYGEATLEFDNSRIMC